MNRAPPCFFAVMALTAACGSSKTPPLGANSPDASASIQDAAGEGSSDGSVAVGDGGSVDAGSKSGTDAGAPPSFDAAGASSATPVDAASPFSGIASTITFSPPAYRLGSPMSAGALAAPQTATFSLTVTDLDGGVVVPSAASPVMLTVYGPNVVSPSALQVTSGAPVTLAYSGGYFASPMTITATWGYDGGSSLGVAQLLPANSLCALGDASVTLPLHCSTSPCTPTQIVENGLNVRASVGGATASDFELDTGSLEMVMPASEMGPNAIGPGPAGMKFYDSDGYEFIGNYYLTTVAFPDSSGTSHTTVPMLVLGTTSTACHSGYPSCVAPANAIHLIGIGIDRNSSTAGDLASGPLFDPFLQLEEEVVAETMSPGYALSGGSAALGMNATIGVTPSLVSDFSTEPLTANLSVPGDWNAAPGCFGFPAFDAGPFCGELLVDVGYPGMFLELPTADRPAPIASADPPTGTVMTISTASSSGPPALDYTFTYEGTNLDTSAPSAIAWSGTAATFVNAGRHLLAQFDYLVDATCGRVGFAPSDAGSP